MNNLKKFTILGIIFVSVIGTLLHFAYDWSGQNFFVGLFTPINESTFEHMKLIFFPMLLFSIFMSYKIGDEYPCVLSISLLSTIIATFLIPVLFYTYTGILGYNITFLDISTFFISVILGFIYLYKNTINCSSTINEIYIIILVAIIAGLFMIFTYNPPDLGIFADPLNQTPV